MTIRLALRGSQVRPVKSILGISSLAQSSPLCVCVQVPVFLNFCELSVVMNRSPRRYIGSSLHGSGVYTAAAYCYDFDVAARSTRCTLVAHGGCAANC